MKTLIAIFVLAPCVALAQAAPYVDQLPDPVPPAPAPTPFVVPRPTRYSPWPVSPVQTPAPFALAQPPSSAPPYAAPAVPVAMPTSPADFEALQKRFGVHLTNWPTTPAEYQALIKGFIANSQNPAALRQMLARMGINSDQDIAKVRAMSQAVMQAEYNNDPGTQTRGTLTAYAFDGIYVTLHDGTLIHVTGYPMSGVPGPGTHIGFLAKRNGDYSTANNVVGSTAGILATVPQYQFTGFEGVIPASVATPTPNPFGPNSPMRDTALDKPAYPYHGPWGGGPSH